MDPGSIVSIISSVGFPIVACIACALYVKFLNDQNRTTLLTIIECHKKETDELRAAVENNTQFVKLLYEQLKGGVIEDGETYRR